MSGVPLALLIVKLRSGSDSFYGFLENAAHLCWFEAADASTCMRMLREHVVKNTVEIERRLKIMGLL